MMLRDATTGIYARSALKERLQEEAARARMTGEPLSLLLIDLDYFKSINDAFGHSRGDAVLMEWAERLRSAIRSGDLPFRYGGDEFVVLLPNTPLALATALAHRLLADVHAQPFAGEPALTLSLSIGVAGFPEDADTPEALFARADYRLFEAKRQGRSRVVDSTATSGAALRMNETVRLVDRDDALGELQRFLSTLPFQHRGVAYVEGVRGSGRSRFLREAQQTAALLGLATLSLCGKPGHRGDPFATLRLALPDLDERALAIEPLSVLFPPRVSDCVGRPALLVLLDDVSEIDRATLELLQRVLASGGSDTVGIVCAVDTSRRAHVTRFHAPSVTTIELRPLSAEAVRVWARTLLQWEPPQAFLSWLHRETRGLPRFLHAGLVLLLERGLLAVEEQGWILRPHYEALRLGDAVGAGVQTSLHNLPTLTTTFIGRVREIETARALLARSRLVTLAGPGGIGKTRLSLELGGEVIDHYPDGVWLVELAAVTDPGLVIAAVASALGLSEEIRSSPLSTVTSHLQHRVSLLILDNCEHVVDVVAGHVDALIRSCPHLKILCTSRETLGVPGEQVFRVPPLSLPALEDLEPHALDASVRAGHWEALRLFRDRAVLARPDWEITPANVAAVTQICRQLDGIPLAIELAAARVRMLSVEQIAARLEDRFRLLTGGSRTALPRQQTLKSLIDWSYQLLSPEEQRLLAALSVFSGGWTLEAAAHVTGDPDGYEVFDGLTRLVDKSLVQVDVLETGEPSSRYRLLETIRQYAGDRLFEAGEADAARDLHLEYYVQMAEAAGVELVGPRQRHWLDRLETEHDNVRAALDWAAARHPEAGLRIVAALPRFWLARGHPTEGRERYAAALAANRERAGESPEVARVYQQALFGAGWLAVTQRDGLVALACLEEALTLAERLDDPAARAQVLCELGYARHMTGDEPAAAAAWETGLRLARSLGDPGLLGFALRAWGFHLQMLYADEEALIALEEGLAELRKTGDEWLIANTLWRIGLTRLWRLGDYRLAADLFQQCEELWTALRDRVGVSQVLGELGWIAYFQGNVAGSRRYFEEFLVYARERKDLRALGHALYDLGKLAQCEGEYEAAVEFLREILHLDPEHFAVVRQIPWALQTLGLIDVLEGREERARERLGEALLRFQERADEVGIGICIQTLARLRVQEAPAEATALFAYASAAVVRAGWRLTLLMHPEDPEDIAALRAALGEREFAAARKRGTRLTRDAALALAVQEGPPAPAKLTCR